MRRLCVFCGSSPGRNGAYVEAAQRLARAMAARGIGLVYGGGSVGVMGAVADAMAAAGGEVIGVIPEFLQRREVAHEGVSDLRVVATMHERKALMADLSDGFVALPGGIGTMEEFFEVWTWTQLGAHGKPCALLNVEGYFDKLLNFLDHMVEERFLAPAHREIVFVEHEPEMLLDRIGRFVAPETDKWLDRDRT
jgi:hypothetical protein